MRDPDPIEALMAMTVWLVILYCLVVCFIATWPYSLVVFVVVAFTIF